MGILICLSAIGALRFAIGRDSTLDLMGVAFPLVSKQGLALIAEAELSLQVRHVQVDNQLRAAVFPVLLRPSWSDQEQKQLQERVATQGRPEMSAR